MISFVFHVKPILEIILNDKKAIIIIRKRSDTASRSLVFMKLQNTQDLVSHKLTRHEELSTQASQGIIDFTGMETFAKELE